MMAINEINGSDRDSASREQAIKRLKKRRDFQGHLLVYALMNGVLVVIWAVVNVHGFFWPIFPILGWGVAVVLNAWDVYRIDTLSEEQIRKEMDRLQRRA
ncbi:2TM domain-containing protein [Actinomycetes bacterium KLBMP 9797]